jgi:uncharacterized protein YrrD
LLLDIDQEVMTMLRSLRKLEGYNVVANDGEVGRVHDFLFNDTTWKIKYLVVSTGKWLGERKVLLPPSALGRPDWEGRMFPLLLNREQIRDCPPINVDEPVSRQHAADFNEFYYSNWNPSWTGKPQKEEDPHLRSIREVVGYRVQTLDDTLGHVDDFIADDAGWGIHLAVVDTRNLFPGRKVMIHADRIESILWGESRVFVNLRKSEMEELPRYDPREPVNSAVEYVYYDYEGKRHCSQ